MKAKIREIYTVLAALGLVQLCGLSQVQGQALNKEQIITEAEKTAKATFDAQGHNYWGRYWMDGVFWAGVADLIPLSDDPDVIDELRRMGSRSNTYSTGPAGPWCMLYHEVNRPHHADDMAIAQSFLSHYGRTGTAVVIADTISRLDQTSAYILSEEAADKADQVDELGRYDALTWSWCDALFMAAPVHAELSGITGDSTYIEAMHLEWQRASDLLYDPVEHLFYRDKSFISKTTENGQKVFWSRGNGWVMGAFARTLPHIPESDPLREGYITQFREMSAKLAEIQRPDGTWSPSLLDYEDFPYPETSGTALNCFAMAWGINNAILDPETYLPVVEAAWSALLDARLANGDLGYVQGVGDQPGGVNASSKTWYGNGAFVMAAVQMAELREDLPTSEISPPDNLTATPVSTTQIDLSWSDNSSDETGFKIERATNSSFTQNLTLVTTTAADTTAYSDSGLTAGTAYYYRVRATNAEGDSANSNTASATTSSQDGSEAVSVLNVNFGRTNESGFQTPDLTSSPYWLTPNASMDGTPNTAPYNGVYVTAANRWNDLVTANDAFPSGSSSLLYSDGTPATGISIGFTGSGKAENRGDSCSKMLLFGYLQADGTTFGDAVNITGLNDSGENQSYDLYIYSFEYAYTGYFERQTQFRVNGTTYDLMDSGETFIRGLEYTDDNYLVIQDVPVINGQLTIEWRDATSAGDGGGPFNGFQLVSTTSASDPYSAWAESHSLEGDDALAANDPDGDGHSNRMEFFFHSNPRVGTPIPFTLGEIAEGPDRFLTITFSRNINAADINARVVRTGNLSGWAEVGTVTAGVASGEGFVSESVDGDIITCVFRDTVPLAGQNAAFMRVELLE